MYEKYDRAMYKATTTKEGILLRLLGNEFEAVFINNNNYNLFDTINYIENLGETKWKITDDGFVCKAINYQPALSETTVVEMWRS